MSEKENTNEPIVEPTVEPTLPPAEELAPVAEVEIPKPVEAVKQPDAITLPEEPAEGPGLAPVANGTIGSTTVKAKKKADKEVAEQKTEPEKVALFSSRNLHWAENGGALLKGYTVVDKAKADKWLTLSGVRLATPEEVAQAFGAGK
jgi:hypothetical protein